MPRGDAALEIVHPPDLAYRVAHSADVADFADWRWQKGQGRWDDPRIASERAAIATAGRAPVDDVFAHEMYALPAPYRPYRVLYVASTRVDPFVEKLQNFREAPSARDYRARLAAVDQDSPDFEALDPQAQGTGVVPAVHVEQLWAGTVSIADAVFADLEHAASVQYIRPSLLDAAVRHGLRDVNRGALLGNERRFTQAVSAWLYDDDPGLGGVCHDSTLGRPHRNWAVFKSAGLGGSRATVRRVDAARVDRTDADLAAACRRLRVRIG